MTTLAANSKRTFESRDAYQDIPVIASDIIYEGAAVGESSSSGTARPLEANDTFLGFADRKADNSAGAASAIDVRVVTKGEIVLSITGVSSTAQLGDTVYASDDDTFTMTAGSNTAIGKLVRWISSTKAVVAFEAAGYRSI
jgi:hypothetical protein